MVKGTKPDLAWSVVGTLAWFGVFNRPLRLGELGRLLLKTTADRAKLRRTIAELGEAVTERDGYYSLADSAQPPDLEQARWHRYKWWRTRTAVGVLGHLPYIEMVAVGNTLAGKTAGPDSDIDVLIVLRHGRLYLGRTIITLALHLFGLRRHGQKIANRVCLSFFVSGDQLDLSGVAFEPYDIYLAYWIAELTPVLEVEQTMERFRAANLWVEELVPRYHDRSFKPPAPSRIARRAEHLFNNPLGDLVERRLAKWQLARINRKSRKPGPDVSIIATHTMLKFHEKERRKLYREQWEKAMRRAGYDPFLILS